MATPHNTAKKGDIAKYVILTGDPVRAKKIKDILMPDAKLVNNIRGMNTYTGIVNGKRLTIMPHGMGCPSMGIYVTELFDYYGVEKIVRIGTIGTLNEKVPMKSVIIAEESYTKTNYDDYFIKNGASFVKADAEMVKVAKRLCDENGIQNVCGRIYCSDNFYTDEDRIALGAKYNLLGVEMESAALYLNAHKFGKKAVALCIVSDSLVSHKGMKAEEKEDMFEALSKVAVQILFEK